MSYCEYFHRAAAQLHGATGEEIDELVYRSSITARYSSMLHAQEYDMETFREETEKIGAHLQQQTEAADD